MSRRAIAVFALSFFACAGTGEDSRSERGSSSRRTTNGGLDQPPVDTVPPVVPPLCPPSGGICIEEFTLALQASEPWPLGRYFLRVALDGRPPTVCEIAFEPVIGAVTDTCNGPDREFLVAYRYDDETRAIETLSFGLLSRLDMEILVAETLPPVVEVHHRVVVEKCSYACERAAPLAVRVQVSVGEPSSVDAGKGDAGGSALDAGPDAAL